MIIAILQFISRLIFKKLIANLNVKTETLSKYGIDSMTQGKDGKVTIIIKK